MELFDYLYGKFNEPDISASFKGKNIKSVEGKELGAVKTLVKWGASINHIEEFDSDLDPRRKRPYDYAKSDEMRDLLVSLGAVSNT